MTLRAAALLLTLTVLAGCNTVEGVGRDLSGAAVTVRGWMGR